MHRYETSTPRVAFGITALAMTAITIGVLVVMPARMYADSHDPGALAASEITTLASTSAVTGATIDIVAVDESGLDTALCRIVQTEPRARRLIRTSSAAELLPHHA